MYQGIELGHIKNHVLTLLPFELSLWPLYFTFIFLSSSPPPPPPRPPGVKADALFRRVWLYLDTDTACLLLFSIFWFWLILSCVQWVLLALCLALTSGRPQDHMCFWKLILVSLMQNKHPTCYTVTGVYYVYFGGGCLVFNFGLSLVVFEGILLRDWTKPACKYGH